MPQFFSTSEPDFEARFTALLGAKREDSPDVDHIVAEIIADVRARGDAAVLELTAKFDRLDLTPQTMRFSEEEMAAECAKVSDADRAALELAAERIRAYHARQMPEDAMWTDTTGAQLGWRWTPVSAAGLYVPGGLASFFRVDERHSGQGRRCRASRHRGADAGWGDKPAGAAGRPDRRCR